MSVEGRKIERQIRRYEFPLLLGLVITWMALWREFSLFTFIGGVVVAFVVMRVFYLPPVELAGRFNLWWCLRYVGYFFSQVAIASLEVAWIAVRPKPVPLRSIIAVRLRTNSDFIVTLVGLTISLIPGSFIVDVDRENQVLFLHVLNTPDQEAVEKMRREVAHIERLLIRTLGSREEVKLVG
ncbi:Na+/H+ antiporter subunit E [Leucobacter sp. UCMA 4100]|uniref:Na+/H+ antiporter subunit E n=1 Tax=Leucobacter sp. UCMA 4100 TaxID=2810534 RepID=UPI0022EB83C9|nr:Na+/H+ antiporter subunit E [Leucobacter sp. UCMA 4100]MDA3148077.1 Na+/H+ antiporter subunit E [Leucobacter sp. UCMA 4100]